MNGAEASCDNVTTLWQPPRDEEVICFLLEWEQVTVTNYAFGIKCFNGFTGSLELIRIRDAHAKLVAMLTQRLADMGGFPPLGSFIGSVRHGNETLHPDVVLKTLQTREEETIAEWKSLLDCDDISSEARALIQMHLLPRSLEYLAVLDRLGVALSPTSLVLDEGFGTANAIYVSC
jgi:hypothetical protein